MSFDKEDTPLKWIKDFIYDHNDLLVALIIILAAGALIYGRMNLILDYPAKVSAMSGEAGQTLPSDTDPVTPSNPGGNEDPNGGAVTPGGNEDPNGGAVTPGGDNPGGDNPGGDTPGGDDNPGGDTPGGDTPTPGPTEYEYVDFHVAPGEYAGWEPLAKGLQYAGIIPDARSLFLRVLERVNMSAIENYNFYTGTYRLPKGADNDTLIDIIRDVSKVTPDN